MALGSMPSRIRDLQRDLYRPEDVQEDAAAMADRPVSQPEAAEERMMIPKAARSKVLTAPVRTASQDLPPVTQRDINVAMEPMSETAAKSVSTVAGRMKNAIAGKPGAFQELAKPAADAIGSFSRGVDREKVNSQVADADRASQMGKISDEERAAAEAQFNALWEADDGAIRSTYTIDPGTENERPDFQSFLDDMVEPGEDPRTALGRVMQNIAGRDGGKDGMGRQMRGYEAQANPLEGPAAVTRERAAELKARGYQTPTSIRYRKSSGPIKGVDRADKGVAINMSGGEDGTGAMVPLGAGMPSAANAHELAGDGQPDREQAFTAEDVAAGNFPTTLDGFAKLLQSGSLDDASETAVVMHLAQQMGYDMSGVPEEDQYNFAQRVVAHNMFRYGDPAQKEWAKSWGSLTGDRYHISKQINPETGKRDKPIADGPMRASVWVKDPGMPGGGYFKDTATQEARGKAQRLKDVAATRAKVSRRATLGPDKQMSEEEIAADMGAAWDKLTPDQQRQFTGEMERGKRVHDFNVARGQAQRRGLTGNAATIGAQYATEMDAAETPLQKLAVSQKFGDPQGVELWSRVVAGDQGIAAAAAGARPGESTPAQQMGDVAKVRQDAIGAVAAGGSPQAAYAVLDPEGQNPIGTHREMAQGVVSTLRSSGQLDSMTPMAIVNHQGIRDYLKDVAPGGAMFKGDGDWAGGWLGKGNDSLSAEFAASVIADLGLRDTPEMRAALDQWWRSQPNVNDPRQAAPPQAAPGAGPAAAPPVSTPSNPVTGSGLPQGFVPPGTGDFIGDLYNFFTR